ncbi:uncharacterized protein LOC143290885 [Babylonia areolata]|uniref:uncharacterized protein LOC143290885 n=1 Tax=Babylonia areolata TaxID=304850 RepID=UPI003FD17D0A
MEYCQILVIVLLVVGHLLLDADAHYYRKRYYSKPGVGGRLYASSRYRGYHSGYRRGGPIGLRTIYTDIYSGFKDKADDRDGNGAGEDDRRQPVVIRLPPNFKMSDLPFYLSTGIFDPNDLPGGEPSPLPTPIVDPVNPSGVFSNNEDDDLNNDLNQIFGTNNNILGGANTNLLAGTNTNLLGTSTNLLGGANTNLLGGTNTNLLGGANTNLLGGANSNVLSGASTNVLGVANTNVLAGASTNVLAGSNANLGGTNTNLLGQGGNTAGLLTGGDPNTDFYSTKTGGSVDLLGGNTLG